MSNPLELTDNIWGNIIGDDEERFYHIDVKKNRFRLILSQGEVEDLTDCLGNAIQNFESVNINDYTKQFKRGDISVGVVNFNDNNSDRLKVNFFFSIDFSPCIVVPIEITVDEATELHSALVILLQRWGDGQ